MLIKVGRGSPTMSQLPLSATFHAERLQLGGQKDPSHSARQAECILPTPTPESQLKSGPIPKVQNWSLIDGGPFIEALSFVEKAKKARFSLC